MKAIAVLVAASMLTACASAPYRPVIDPKGQDMANFHIDLTECRELSEVRDAGASAADGAVAGAIFGALLGAAIGGSDGAKLGAKAFAVQGAAAGAGDAVLTQQQIVKNCMSGRGYKVLA